MNEEKCMKESEILDLKKRIGRIEDNDRQDYGLIKELAANIKTIAESTKEQSEAVIETGKTMVSMKENLDILNQENKQIKNDVNELKEKFNNQQIENIKSHSFDFINFTKNKIIPFLIGGGIIYIIIELIN